MYVRRAANAREGPLCLYVLCGVLTCSHHGALRTYITEVLVLLYVLCCTFTVYTAAQDSLHVPCAAVFYIRPVQGTAFADWRVVIDGVRYIRDIISFTRFLCLARQLTIISPQEAATL